MRKFRAVLLEFAGLALILVAGCAPGQTTAPSQTATTEPTVNPPTSQPLTQVPGGTPASMYVFAAEVESGYDRYYFLLADDRGLNAVGDGHVRFELLDANEKSLYQREFDVKAADFVENIIQPGNIAAGKRYEWRVTLADTTRGVSPNGLGTAVCTFTPTGGKAFSAKYGSARILVYTDGDLAQQEVDAYEQAAVTVNLEQVKADMVVKVLRAGFFTPYIRGGSGQTYMRVDLEVTNRAAAANTFMPLDLAISDYQLNEYTRAPGGTLQDTQRVAAGQTITGYYLFEGVPPNLDLVRLRFKARLDQNNYFYDYDFIFNLMP